MVKLALTVEEFAESIGVCRATVFSWLRLGLPNIRAGRVRRVLVAEAMAWLQAGGANKKRKVNAKRAP
jgi:predicted site-specific integrase-resolvase